MGVADNRTYKNEYLFTGKYDSILKGPSETAKDNPSINVPPKINSTIKENPYRSNVEIEGDEIVLQPDLSALFKAVGKSHKQGGMDVLLRPDSFIFSDFEDLKLSPKDHELFELKEGGKTATNTPADVLKRNVDLKHYNNLVTILEDPFKDDLAKNSAAKMLDKYIKTLGNVAFIQESKKGMPQGVPDFAMGTAPVYDPQLKERIMENKQYAKAGGRVGNPYQAGGYPKMSQMEKLGKMLFGEINGPSPILPTIQLSDEDIYGHRGDGTPNRQRQDRYIGQRPPYPDTWTNYFDRTQGTQYTAPDWINPKTFYSIPGLVDYMKTLDKQSGIDWDMNKADDAVWGWRHQAALAKFFPYYGQQHSGTPTRPDREHGDNTGTHKPEDILPTPGDVNGPAQGVKRADWKFTPLQKMSHLNDWMNWANVDKYGARRAHYDATYINPALVNPEQAVGDVRALANQQVTAANVLNPILRNAQGSQAFGQTLNAIPGIRSQYDNQNAGIVNQFRQYNNQVKNNETMVNMQNDMNYERDSTTADVNYKNMKNYLKNQALSNTMADVATNQKLAYNLLTQNNPAYGFDWDTGNFYRNKKNILDVQSNQTKGIYDDIMEGIKKLPDSDPKKWEIYEKLLRQKNILPYLQSSNPIGKKGGKVKNPYK